MRAVVQRVTYSNVKVDGSIVGEINKGFNVLIGISKEDTEEDMKYIKDKVINLRVFEDENDKISQVTLYGDVRKGRRPNFMNALGGDEAKIFYDKFIEMMKETGLKIETGIFGANMKVDIQNDGPVTILLDSNKDF